MTNKIERRYDYCVQQSVNPRDGLLWEDSKRYSLYLKAVRIIKLLVGTWLTYKLIFVYNKYFKPKFQ